MFYKKRVVIILSLLIISCSLNNKLDSNNDDENIHISLPVELPQGNIDKYYVVKKGDTLYSLGVHLKVNYKKIAARNQIKAPYSIEEGQKIFVDKLAINEKYKKTLRKHKTLRKQRAQIKQRAKEKKKIITAKVTLTNTEELSKNKQFLGKHSLQRDLLVDEVLLANPQLEMARAVWKASTAKIDQNGALQDPVFSYALAPFTVDSDSTDFVQQFQLSQQFPWPGKLSLQTDAAILNAIRDEEIVNVQHLELTALAKKLYGDWYLIHQAHLIHHENVQLLTHVNKIAKIRYRIGKASQQEVLQSELELSLITQHKFVLNQQKTEILGHINRLLGRPVGRPLPYAKKLPRPRLLRTLKRLQLKAIEDHPKIKALSADIEAWELKKKRAQLSVLPDFNVKAGYSTQMNNKDKHFTVGLALNLPLNLSKYRAMEDEASANLKRAEWKKLDQVRELEELIQLYFSKVKKYQKTLKLYKHKILPLAKQNKRAALAEYQASNGGFLELIRAEKDWHSAQLKEKQMLVDYHESLALFEHAIGITKVSSGQDL